MTQEPLPEYPTTKSEYREQMLFWQEVATDLQSKLSAANEQCAVYMALCDEMAGALQTCEQQRAGEYSGYAYIGHYNEDLVEQALAKYQKLTINE